MGLGDRVTTCASLPSRANAACSENANGSSYAFKQRTHCRTTVPSRTPVTAIMPSACVRSRLTDSGPRRVASASVRPSSSAVASPTNDRPSEVMSDTSGVSNSIVIPTRIYVSKADLALFGKTNQGNMSSALDGGRQLTLMAQAIAGNATRNNASPLRQQIAQEPHIFEIN